MVCCAVLCCAVGTCAPGGCRSPCRLQQYLPCHLHPALPSPALWPPVLHTSAQVSKLECHIGLAGSLALLGQALHALGRAEDAQAHVQRASDLVDPSAPHLTLLAARMHLQLLAVRRSGGAVLSGVPAMGTVEAMATLMACLGPDHVEASVAMAAVAQQLMLPALQAQADRDGMAAVEGVGAGKGDGKGAAADEEGMAEAVRLLQRAAANLAAQLPQSGEWVGLVGLTLRARTLPRRHNLPLSTSQWS